MISSSNIQGWLRLSKVVLCLLFFPVVALCQAPDAITSGTLVIRNQESRLLRIGFLREEGESDLTAAQMAALRRALMGDRQLLDAMAAEGFTDIGLFPTDGAQDMQRRLDALEFHLAFIPSRVWATQGAGYEVILKTRRARDITSARGGKVFQQGVLFISPRSPFFDDATIDATEFADYLRGQRIAVVASQNMAGFVAPMLEMSGKYHVTRTEGGYLWCESSAEVTKAVLAGLVDVGACEAGAMDEALKAAGLEDSKDKLRKIVLQSSPVPTDPVVVAPGLSPRHSEVGRRLRAALLDWSVKVGFGSMSLQEAQNNEYDVVREMLGEFGRQVGEVPR